MLSSAMRSTAFEMHMAERPDAHSVGSRHLILRPTEDGWSLITPQGELVFRGRGLGARRQCLQAASERGVFVVLS